MSDVQLKALSRALDQTTELLGAVSAERLGDSTPCSDWTVADLIDHMVRAPAKFADSVRGEQVDWLAPTPHVGDDRAVLFRAGADELLAAWRETGTDGVPIGPDLQSAEIAVHTYDLATALGRGTDDLDPEPAERGLAFMQANLG